MRSLCGLRQTIIHCGKDRVTGHGAAGHGIHTGGGTGSGQGISQRFGSSAAQLRGLAGSVDGDLGDLAAGNGQPERVEADVAEQVDAGLRADGTPYRYLTRIQPQTPDQAADHRGQRVAGKVRAHGQVAGEIAEHIRAHAGHHADDRAEQHADGCVAKKAEADAQVGRQLDGQTQQVKGDVDGDEQGGHGKTARAFQLTQRADEDILLFLHRKRHLHNKFICCHSDLGDA